MEDKAKTIANLKKCRDEYLERMDDCEVVIFQWRSGGRGGIGNPERKKKLLRFCADEAQKQIDLLEGREPEKFYAVVINDEYAASAYEDGGIDALNEYCLDNYVSPIVKEFASEELMQAYLDGMCDIAGGDERAPASYLVITDKEELKKLDL